MNKHRDYVRFEYNDKYSMLREYNFVKDLNNYRILLHYNRSLSEEYVAHMSTTTDKYKVEKIEAITIDQSQDTHTTIAWIVDVHLDM